MALQEVPTKMIVIGAGVIGLELGSVYSRLGTEVTVVEYLNRLAPTLDTEVATTLQKILTKQGLKFVFNAKVVGGSTGPDSAIVKLDPASPGIDVPSTIEGPMLAHKAEEEGIFVVEHMTGQGGHINYDAIPSVIYTMPEVAQVGKTEEQLIASKIPYTKGSFPFLANSRARANQETDGFVKALAHKDTNVLLGLHIIGPLAGEIIMEPVLGMEYGASGEDIARTCHAHPGYGEAIKEACLATYGKTINF